MCGSPEVLSIKESLKQPWKFTNKLATSNPVLMCRKGRCLENPLQRIEMIHRVARRSQSFDRREDKAVADLIDELVKIE
jgi:hypothetical protein